MIRHDNYATILGFMTQDLNLKGNELIIYAIIYGFSQSEEQTFRGSLQYLAEWTGSTRQSVLRTLKSLTDKGFIDKREVTRGGVKFCEYSAKRGCYQNNNTVTKMITGCCQNDNGGVIKKATNIKEYNTVDNNKISKNNNRSSVHPTLDEIKAYCKERGNKVDPNRFFDHYEANGWRVGRNPMRDWKAAVRYWERDDKSNTQKRFDLEREYDDDFYKELERRG